MLLNNEGKKEFINNMFHQYFDISLESDIQEENITQFVNFVLPISTINEFYDCTKLSKFFNQDYNNVIFSSTDNNYIYRYEIYQGVYFIRMEPFSKTIRMHIIPKKYDASNTLSDAILFFKDNKEVINENNFRKTDSYTRNENKNIINSYYNEDDAVASYCMYKFDIKDKTRNIKSLQINMGYSYNDSNPTNKLKHYSGVLDESNEVGVPINPNDFTEFNSTLIDMNLDNNGFTNEIGLLKSDNDSINFENDNNINHKSVGLNNNSHTINQIYHKTLKYINDDLYIEENGKHLFREWEEVDW